MIKVSSKVTVYEIDGTECKGLDKPVVSVESDWNRNTMVVLEFAGRRMTVPALDLHAAITNATNTGSR